MKKLEEEKKKEEWELFNLKLMEYDLPANERELIKQDIIHKETEILRYAYKNYK